MYRVENKYMLADLDMHILEHRISSILKPDDYSQSGGYLISSVYFDDLYDTCLNDTLDGLEIRSKYRIRIYNNSFDIIKLEIKHKNRNRIQKDSCNISYEELRDLLKGKTIRDHEVTNSAIVEFNLAIKNRGLRPKVIVTYNRNAYVNSAGNVRITFDRNVRASSSIELFGNPELVYTPIGKTNELEDILEIKYDELLPSYIANTLEYGNLWQTSFSKYALCREAIQCQ